MSDDPILRANLSDASIEFDPSEDGLFLYLQAIERGEEEFVVIERIVDGTAQDQVYIQSAYDPDAYAGFTVERREGSPDDHFGVIGLDLVEAHALLTAWCFGLPMPEAAWERIEF